jgi:lysophospholipase L1-like esterase
MDARYGRRAALRKAGAALACGIFIFGPIAARAATPQRLLVLGDSLAAGYGLAHEDGFEARLAEALA